MSKPTKPLGRKAYGSIPHVPGSRLGEGDHHCAPGQAKICTEKPRDRHDRIWVTEKLDGSCCAVAKVDGQIIALGRAGYPAFTSRYEQHHFFAVWVQRNEERFRDALVEGQRIVGEWLAQAHGTRYDLPHEPFVAFDLMAGERRLPWAELLEAARSAALVTPSILDIGPLSIEEAMARVRVSGHGALDPVEGVVWRVEREGRCDFLAKYVRHDKIDGCYLPEVSGEEAVWMWRP